MLVQNGHSYRMLAKQESDKMPPKCEREKSVDDARADCKRKAGRPCEGGGPAGDRSGLLASDQFSVDVNVIDDDDTRAGLGSVVDDQMHALHLAARSDSRNHLGAVGWVNA